MYIDLLFLVCLENYSAPSCDHFGSHGGLKHLATKLAAKVANFAACVLAVMCQAVLSSFISYIVLLKVFLKFNCLLSHQCRRPGCNLRHTYVLED